MNLQKFYETPKGLETIREKIKKLDGYLNCEIPDALAKAAAFGDRSENAEYDEAKRWQREAQDEVGQLKQYLSNVIVADKQKEYNKVIFGCYVKVLENSENKKTFKIVGKYESDASCGLICYDSPLAKALLNKTKGDFIEFCSRNGKVSEYEILEIGHYENC